jgi:hypothetical protein
MVFVWNGKSVIDNIEPYTFPIFFLWGIPAVFLFIGIPMACMGHIAGKRNGRN